MPDLRFGTASPTAATGSPTPRPTDHPLAAGSPTKEPSVSPVAPQTLEIVGQLTLKGRYDTLRQYAVANGIDIIDFGEDVVRFMIGDSASNGVEVEIIEVFRGSPNVFVQYRLSATNSFALDTALQTISFQIAAGAVYTSGDLSYPVIANQLESGEGAMIIEGDTGGGSAGGTVPILVAVTVGVLFCAAIVVAAYCLRAKRKRDRDLKAMAEIAALPGFQVVNSEDMPFETGTKGHHVVASASFDFNDLMRITPNMMGVGAGHARVPSLELLEAESGDETGASPTNRKPMVPQHPSMGDHLSLPGGVRSH